MSLLTAIANVIFIVGIVFWVYKQENTRVHTFWLAFLLKVTSGILLGMLYTWYYPGGDTFLFFNESVPLSSWAYHDGVGYLKFLATDDTPVTMSQAILHQPRTLFFIKIVSLINLLTGNNYYLTSLYFSTFSFLCSWRLVTTLIQYFPEGKTAAIISFLFLPSVVWWGSGVLKESLAMGVLCLVAHAFLRIWMKQGVTLITAVLALASVWMLWQLKYYYAALLLPVMCTSLLAKFIIIPIFHIKRPVLQVIVWLCIFIVPLFLVSLLRYNFHIENVLSVAVGNNNVIQRASSPVNVIHYDHFEASAVSFLVNAPWALFSGLFRPFPWEAKNLLSMAQAVENFMLLIIVITSVRNSRQILHSTHALLILSVLVYTVLLCVFLALSTPNFGTLSRYRIGFLPFLFFIVSFKNKVMQEIANFMQRTFYRLVR